MLEAIFEFIGEIFIYGFLKGVGKLLIWIGSQVFSLFSLYEVKPSEHRKTESLDKKAAMLLTGFLLCVAIIMLFVKLF